MRHKSRWLYWISFILVALLLAVYVERRDLWGRFEKYRQDRNEIRALQSQLGSLVKEEQRRKGHVANLGTNPIEIEAAIRRSKHLVRPGETIYRVETPDGAPSN